MLKVILYATLTVVGMIATFVNPLYGVIASLEGYLLNPSVMASEITIFRVQLCVTVAFLVSWIVKRERGLAPVGNEVGALICLWIFVTIGSLSAFWALASSEVALESIYEVFKTVLVVSVMVRVIRTERGMSVVMLAMIIGVWHAAFLHTFGNRLGYVPAAYTGRNGSVLPDAQEAVMVLFFPSLVLLATLGKGVERIVSWGAMPFVLNSVVSTYERTGFVSLVVESIIILLFLPKRITLRLLPCLVAGGCIFVFRLTPENYWQRVDTISAPTQEASANSRFVINQASKRMFLDHPILGVGYRNYPYISPMYLDSNFLTEGKRSAHNSYFTVLCETGIAGFVPWISAFLGAAWLLRRIRKQIDMQRLTKVEIYAMGFEVGLYGWLSGGCFQAHHEVDPAYWFVGFAVVLTRLHQMRQERWNRGGEQEARAIAEVAVG